MHFHYKEEYEKIKNVKEADVTEERAKTSKRKASEISREAIQKIKPKP